MSLKMKDAPTSTRKSVPSGTHIARVTYVCDLGVQTIENKFGRKDQPTVRICWELPECQTEFVEGEGPQPFTFGKQFHFSKNPRSNLRQMLEAWRGKAYTDEEIDQLDLTKLVGRVALLNIVNESMRDGSGTYAKLSSVSMPPKSMVCPPAILKPWTWSFADGQNEVWKGMPEWLQEKIGQSQQARDAARGGGSAATMARAEDDPDWMDGVDF